MQYANRKLFTSRGTLTCDVVVSPRPPKLQ